MGARDEEQKERAQELEERLNESNQQVDNLDHSLQQETQLRNSAEGKIVEVYTCAEDVPFCSLWLVKGIGTISCVSILCTAGGQV